MEIFHVTVSDDTGKKMTLDFADYAIAHAISERAKSVGYNVSLIASHNDVQWNVDDAWRKLRVHFDPEDFRVSEAIGAIYENLNGDLPYLDMVEKLREIQFTKMPRNDNRHIIRDERTGTLIDTGLGL